jgi:hypothetical protein
MDAQRGGTKVDLVGVGLNATDTVIPVSAFPAPGSKTEYSEHSVLLGGEISTAVIACRRWGLRTRYIGRLGDDRAARLHRAAFDDVGVETRIATVDDASSPQSLILVHHRRRGYLPCRLCLRPSAGLAHRTPAGLCLRRRRAQLYSCRRSWAHRNCQRNFAPDGRQPTV